MEEKVLITSECSYSIGKFVKAFVVFLALILIVAITSGISNAQRDAAYDKYKEVEDAIDELDYDDYYDYNDYYSALNALETKADLMWDKYLKAGDFMAGVCGFVAVVSAVPLVLSVIFLILFLLCYGKELVITNKRVYGVTKRTRMDLPLDSITAISLLGRGAIVITTPSGALRYFLLKNRDKMYYTMCELLIERNTKCVEPKAEAENAEAAE